MSSFKEKYNLDKRLGESTRIMQKYPDRLPVIVENSENSDLIPTLDKNKYLVPSDMTIGQFVYILRKRIKLPPEKAMFLFINNKLIPCSEIINKTYVENVDDDMFLYMKIQGENTFGNL
jgi:GABA(A) receptor-associated protein